MGRIGSTKYKVTHLVAQTMAFISSAVRFAQNFTLEWPLSGNSNQRSTIKTYLKKSKSPTGSNIKNRKDMTVHKVVIDINSCLDEHREISFGCTELHAG